DDTTSAPAQHVVSPSRNVAAATCDMVPGSRTPAASADQPIPGDGVSRQPFSRRWSRGRSAAWAVIVEASVSFARTGCEDLIKDGREGEGRIHRKRGSMSQWTMP